MKDLKTQLMEKYFHSQGAALCDEGRVDKAIAFLQQAIALDDRSYTRCDLSLAFIQKNNLDRAFDEIDRAVALSPQTARYYHERGLLHQARGNKSEGRKDLNRAIDLDGNYGRIDEIKEALQVLEKAASSRVVSDSDREERISSPVLKRVLAHVQNGAGLAIDGMDAVSCTLPCPAFCCHFEGNPLLHGLSIGPWKLLKIKELLKEKGLPEDQFLHRVDLTGKGDLQCLIPPHHLLHERGRTHVYSPQKGRARLKAALLTSLPKGRHYQDLVWIHEHSWACSFLEKGRCAIHDVGDEPALPACKEFLCLTGFVFALLVRWDLIEERAIDGKTMEQLNEMAVDGALILAKELLGAEDLKAIKLSLDTAVADALNADQEGENERVDRLLGTIQDLNTSLEKAVAARKGTVRERIARTFDSKPTLVKR